MWDRWVELYGATLDAFYPVADTEIGRLGVMMANEGSYPENARGLAMNGAEVVYRASYPHPLQRRVSRSRTAPARSTTTSTSLRRTSATYYLTREDSTCRSTPSAGSR